MRTLGPIAVVAAAVALLGASFLIGSTPDEEEFRFAVLSTWLHVNALRDGQLPFWTNLLGLGVPQPFIPNFQLHPLAPLLVVLTPVTWVQALLAVHLAIGATGAWRLVRHVGAEPLAAGVAAATYFMSTPSQNYLLVDFWPSHFIVWTSAPWLLLLAWRALGAEGRALHRSCVALGVCSGIVLACTNPGHAAVYAVVVLAIVVTRWRDVVPRIAWLTVAAAIAVAMISPTLAVLWGERQLFAAELTLANLPDPLPWYAIATLFAAPLGTSDDDFRLARLLFFGGPFALLGVAGCLREWRRHPDLVLIVIAGLVLVFSSVIQVPLVSARYHFRDPLTLAAIPLAALALDRLLRAPRRVPLAALAIGLQLAAVVFAAWPALARTWVPDGLEREKFDGATASRAEAEILLSLTRAPGRLAFSPALDTQIYEGLRLYEGLGVNALAYRGLPTVNGWFKGVSTGAVWPDERLFYGRIRVPEQVITVDAALDVLGIRYVLAVPGEAVAPELRMRGTIPEKSGSHFVLYENDDPWPAAAVLDRTVLSHSGSQLPGCVNTRLLCTDVGSLRDQRVAAAQITYERGGAIDIELGPETRPRVLMLSQMFRREWQATAEGVPLTTTAVADGLLGVIIPPGTTSVQVRYRPTLLMIATAAAWLALSGGLAALSVLARAGAASARAPTDSRRDHHRRE